ncbi:uncharacterized protein LOC128671211 [Plodia interpunctella]|uniref:uncharacterized protein LOC128671211 n=1 Tax=Plodia interpunctella TaxID=58824 RepID=UPI002368B5ED|nr:uncharacterized protein LOC128671211 [Plodia interpunctella]
MLSNTVKCSNCNVVINEVLSFLQNVLDVMDEESIHQLCTTSFSPEDIVKAKSLLYESIPSGKKMPVRRKDGKKNVSRDLEDMISLLKRTDPELYPVFVARDLHKLPPVTFDHVDVTRLLKDISRLQYRVSGLEKTTVSTESFELLKQEVHDMKHASLINSSQLKKNVNKNRGACLQTSFEYDSGPIGLQYVPIKHTAEGTNSEHEETADSKHNGQSILVPTTADECNECVVIPFVQEQLCEIDCARKEERDENATDMLGVSGKEDTPVDAQTSVNHTQSPTNGQHAALVSTRSSSSESWASMVAEQRANACKVQVNSEQKVGAVTTADTEWKQVQNKRLKQNRLASRKGRASTSSDVKFKAAIIQVPLLISNVSKDTNEEDIISYIKDKTGEIVTLKKINIKPFRKYNAFKLYVSKHKAEIFLNDDLWPDGIVFRRFVHFMYRTKDSRDK